MSTPLLPARRRRIRRPTARGALVAAVTLSGALALSACAVDPTVDERGRPKVVASFYPFEFVARQVGGDDVAVTNLTKPGAEPHDLELTPRQVVRIASASLVVYLEGLQPAVDEAVQQNRPRAWVDAAAVVPLEDHGSRGEDEDGESERYSSGPTGDPHIWLDPTKLARVAAAVGDALTGVDPAHAAAYRSRTTALRGRLGALDAEYRTGLSACRRHEIVTTHAAFGYLAERYGLRQIGISGLNPEDEPSPARLTEIQRAARVDHVTTIFFETLASPKTARALARDLHVSAAVLDPIEGISDQDNSDYFSVMRANLAALRKALECR